jgi:hypothetical protein
VVDRGGDRQSVSLNVGERPAATGEPDGVCTIGSSARVDSS